MVSTSEIISISQANFKLQNIIHLVPFGTPNINPDSFILVKDDAYPRNTGKKVGIHPLLYRAPCTILFTPGGTDPLTGMFWGGKGKHTGGKTHNPPPHRIPSSGHT